MSGVRTYSFQDDFLLFESIVRSANASLMLGKVHGKLSNKPLVPQ
jgi:hypothetical protein